VPDCVFVGTATPKVNVPTEAINWLTAHAAKSRPECVCGFAPWRGWRTEGKGQAAPAVPEPPSPAAGRLAASRECSRQAIGADGMSTPVRLDGKPRRRRHEGAGKSPSTTRGKIGGNALLRRRADRPFRSALSSCQPDIVRPPAAGASCDQDVNHLSPTPLFDDAEWKTFLNDGYLLCSM